MEVLSPAASNQAESTYFIKSLIAVAMSTICYYRKLFPADLYEDQEFEGLKLKILVGRRNCATQLIQCMNGCYDSIDKGYLRQIMFGICDNCKFPEVLTECYIFTIDYTVGAIAALRLHTNSNDLFFHALQAKRSTLRMLQTIRLLCQRLGSPPKEAGISIKIIYYDDRTPSDYQPAGFMWAESESFSYRNKHGFTEPDAINGGKVETLFHALHLGIKYASYKDNQTGHQELPTSSARSMRPHIFGQRSRLQYNREGKKCQLLSYHQVCKCPCEREHVEPAMLFCISCNTFQHSVCFGKVTNEYNTAVQEGTVCLQCAVGNSRATSHDPSMASLAEDQAKETCLYRQALYFLLKSRSMFVSKITLRLQLNVGYAELNALCSRLTKDRCVRSKSAQVLSVQRQAVVQKAKELFGQSFTKLISRAPRPLNGRNLILSNATS